MITTKWIDWPLHNTPFVFFPEAKVNANKDFIPSATFTENENDYEWEVELPGVSKENIELTFNNYTITVKATRKKGESECVYSRTCEIPETADPENICATFENGLLVLKISKKQQPEIKKIAIA